MHEQVKRQILDRIMDNDTILIFRHKRMDGDCVGASLGLRGMLRLTWPEKSIKTPWASWWIPPTATAFPIKSTACAGS